MPEHAKGFETLDTETTIDTLPVEGHLPDWLEGTLIRNGPGRFELSDEVTYNHWFDGMAMLHRFTIGGGNVSYGGKYIRSKKYVTEMETGKVAFSEFATDPCRTVFGRIFSAFDPAFTDNTSINVTQLDDAYIAMTETPMAIEFDPKTLETLGHYDFNDTVVKKDQTTAHPLYDPATNEVVNFATHFNLPKSAYRVYKFAPGSRTRELVGEFVVDRPGYMHSFALTPNFVILTEMPLTAAVKDLAFSGKPFIQNYVWNPEKPARFIVFHRASGEQAATFTAAPYFMFHHINAFERDGEIVIDLVAYEDSSTIDALYVDNLRTNTDYIGLGKAVRYCLDMETSRVDRKPLGDVEIELPRVNSKHMLREYQYVYGIGYSGETGATFSAPV
ncbi:MAG: carotenoid oxygenase family protein, partial [Chloroflexota bacterium]